jgi:hypothetical protein
MSSVIVGILHVPAGTCAHAGTKFLKTETALQACKLQGQLCKLLYEYKDDSARTTLPATGMTLAASRTTLIATRNSRPARWATLLGQVCHQQGNSVSCNDDSVIIGENSSVYRDSCALAIDSSASYKVCSTFYRDSSTSYKNYSSIYKVSYVCKTDSCNVCKNSSASYGDYCALYEDYST